MLSFSLVYQKSDFFKMVLLFVSFLLFPSMVSDEFCCSRLLCALPFTYSKSDYSTSLSSIAEASVIKLLWHSRASGRRTGRQTRAWFKSGGR